MLRIEYSLVIKPRSSTPSLLPPIPAVSVADVLRIKGDQRTQADPNIRHSNLLNRQILKNHIVHAVVV